MLDEIPNARPPKTCAGRFGRWVVTWVYIIGNTLFAERRD